MASNPRLVKEAQALTKNGYAVHLIFTQYVSYLINFDNDILSNNAQWTYDCLDRTVKNKQTKFLKFLSVVFQKSCTMLLLSGKKYSLVLAQATNRYFFWQFKKAVKAKADLYIAHNLAALPVAVLAAKKNKVKCGFDAEDFHRQETTDDLQSIDFTLKSNIENAFIPKLNYLSVASPLIGKAYHQLYKNQPIGVLNVFPRTKKVTAIKLNQPLKFVWFSQYIGFGRGLEMIFTALSQLAELDFELHLIGFLSAEMKSFMQSGSFPSTIISKIMIHAPLPPDQLLSFISQFDIGLATEISQPLNRNICLSNKIFSYIQAGLAILASDTTAQKQLFSSYPQIGKLYAKNSIENLTACIKKLYADRELLLLYKKNAFELGQTTLNWETESVKFLKVIEETLAD